MVELTIRGEGLRELLEVLNALARPGGAELPVTPHPSAPPALTPSPAATPRDEGAAGGANALGVQGEGFDGAREYELARAQMKSVEAGIENIMSFSVGGKTGLEGKEE